jgi:hypothetical protein
MSEVKEGAIKIGECPYLAVLSKPDFIFCNLWEKLVI